MKEQTIKPKVQPGMQPLIRWVMPASLLDRMYATEQSYTAACWNKGDEAVEAIQHVEALQAGYKNGDGEALALISMMSTLFSPKLAEEFLTLGRMAIYGWFSKETGNSKWKARTIRRFAYNARFYDAKTREHFEILPFAHFDFARGYGEDATEILAISVALMDSFGGRPPSIEHLEHHLAEGAYSVESLEEDGVVVDSELRSQLAQQAKLVRRFERIYKFVGNQVARLFADNIGKREQAKIYLQKLFALLAEPLDQPDGE